MPFFRLQLLNPQDTASPSRAAKYALSTNVLGHRQHTQRLLQRSISSDEKQRGESARKAQDMAAMQEVYKKRQTKSQKPQKPEKHEKTDKVDKPDKPDKPRKVKKEKGERRRRTMSVIGPGSAADDPMVIDD